jgi:hypothetical protein
VTSLEAKDILLLYRLGAAGQEDPEFAAALELVQSDPELAQWFDDHCALQTAMRAKFQQIPVPEGLQEQILSERKAHLSLSHRRKVTFAVATAVLLCLGVALFYPRSNRNDSFSNFRGRMAATVLRQYPKMDLLANDPQQIRQYLASRGEGGYLLPQGLARTTPTGCALLKWRGKPVTMICFDSGSTTPPGTPDLFLFIVARSALADAPANSPQSPASGHISRLATASWSAGDKTYLLGALGSEKLLQNHL